MPELSSKTGIKARRHAVFFPFFCGFCKNKINRLFRNKREGGGLRLAGVDIGSNTTLLLAADRTASGFQVLSDRIYFTRLAEGMRETGRLSQTALLRLESAFASIKSIVKELKPDRLSIAATSAARGAANKNELLKLGEKHGLSPIDIISPEREAELTFIGSLFGLGHENLSSPIVVDIGGGSTELASSSKSCSLDLGSVALTEKFLTPQALSRIEMSSLKTAVESGLEGLGPFLRGAEGCGALVCAAGTPVTLAFMEKKTSDPNKIHGLALSAERVEFWLKKLAGMSLEERKSVPYLPEHRSDVIVSGLMILSGILEKAKKSRFIVSAGGVRYGLIWEQAQQSR